MTFNKNAIRAQRGEAALDFYRRQDLVWPTPMSPSLAIDLFTDVLHYLDIDLDGAAQVLDDTFDHYATERNEEHPEEELSE